MTAHHFGEKKHQQFRRQSTFLIILGLGIHGILGFGIHGILGLDLHVILGLDPRISCPFIGQEIPVSSTGMTGKGHWNDGERALE